LLAYRGLSVSRIRTTGDPARDPGAVTARGAGRRSVAPDRRGSSGADLDAAVDSRKRLVARLATAFGALALLLAGIGLYGVMTYAIARRTGEIGLRVALGARRQDVLTMVMTEALRLVGVGLAIGLPLALASTRLLQTQLHGIDAVDAVSLIAAVAVLTASALIAVLVRATRA
jgi:predicted lysophospholipase L1 biosynthesis ABC-type transport system permease subunit